VPSPQAAGDPHLDLTHSWSALRFRDLRPMRLFLSGPRKARSFRDSDTGDELSVVTELRAFQWCPGTTRCASLKFMGPCLSEIGVLASLARRLLKQK